MKINRKNQLLNSILMMQECHRHIMQSQDDSEQIELLQLCQEMAVQVGTLVEEQVSDNVTSQNIVEILEQYCDEVFQVSQVIEIGSEEIGQAIGVCESTLGKAQDNIGNLQSEKMVAVFLPYNASMWDALDTVCRSAMQEEEWETYVMPIPYYSLTVERKVDKNHFEYELFPQELPLVDYRKCPLESLQPDVIFYHNPYDDYNRVTSVHPDFYSRNLQKITKQLVYIPYYLSEQMTGPHMVTLPGIQNAWKVMVQTEAIRKQFLEEYPEDKIINLGSPKMDRLMNEVHHPSPLPQEWQDKIAGKKVLFFNTHLTSVMNQPEKFLDMITYVMEVMERNQDIIVLWRPHPLMKETITSFHEKPFLKKQYEQCIHTFKSLPNAIYDETSELHRSMAISHAYIGTQKSSVFRMYKHLNRPIYVMNDIFSKENPSNGFIPRSNVGVVYQNRYWQVDYRINALFQTDLHSSISTYVTTFSHNSIWENNSYQCRGQQNGWLILVPTTRRELVLYHVNSGDIKYIALEKVDYEQPGGWSIDSSELGILLTRKHVEEYGYWISLSDYTCEHIPLPQMSDQIRIVTVYDQEIWMIHDQDNRLESYHIETKVKRAYQLPVPFKTKQAITFIHVSNGNFYLIDRGSASLVVIRNYLGEYSVRIVKLGEGERAIPFTQFIDSVLVLSFQNSSTIYAFDMEREQLKVLLEDKEQEGLHSYSLGAKCENDCYIMPSPRNNKSYRIHIENGFDKIAVEEMTSKACSNHQEVEQLIQENEETNCIIHDEFYGLEDFIQHKLNLKIDEKVNGSGSGVAIWNYVRNEL
ncbi:MAG: hypothetical protein R3Y67_09305 [Eubacteriales bacterium]